MRCNIERVTTLV